MDEQLKQRLLGATIIVALVVIFVPMLFEDPDHPASQAASEASALPEAIEQRTLDLPKSAADAAQQQLEPSKPKTSGKAESGYTIYPLEDPPPPPKPAAKPAPPPPPQPEAAAPAEEPVLDAGEEGAEFVGEGEEAPMDEGEAPAVAKPGAPVPKAGLVAPGKPAKPGTKPSKSKDALAHPEAAPAAKPETAKPKAAAPKPVDPAAKKPAAPKSGQVKPAEPLAEKPPVPKPVVPKPVPAQPEPAAAPPKAVQAEPPPKPATPAKPPEAKPESKPPTAWMVQAGSFSGEGNARALAEKLRKQNIPAFVETVSGSSGVSYRVRVGPGLNRGRAEQVQKQIESAVGIKGIILPRK
jgi:DedD protein